MRNGTLRRLCLALVVALAVGMPILQARCGYGQAGRGVPTDQNGTSVSNTFDSLNRVTAQAISPGPNVLGTTARSYQYDGLSRQVSVTDNNGSGPDDDTGVSFAYDGLSRVVSTAQTLGTNSKTVSYTYDGVGNCLTITYPDSTVVSQTLDALDRTTAIGLGAGAVTPLVQYSYAGFARTVERKYFAGATATPISTNTIAYDGIQRPVHFHNQLQDATPIARFDYGYDKVGNKLWEEKLHDPQNSERYTYDKLYRLTQFKRGQLDGGKQIPNPTLTKAWNLDNVHNWTAMTVGQLSEWRMHDWVNQVNSRWGPHQPDVHTVGLWHFEETTGSAKDSSACRNDGTVTCDMRQGPGQHGNAYWFDGTNDKVEVADSDSLDVTGDLTVEAWVSGWGMGSRVICAKWGDAGQRSYQLKLHDDKLVGSLSANGTDAVSVTSAASVWAGTHVAMRLRGTELSLWIGGVKDTQTAVFNGPIHKSTAPLGIAWQADPNSPCWFSGTIDEVRVSRFARGNFGNPTLTYDDNGNLTSDGDLKLSYDFLNRLVKVKRAADDSLVAEYAYDALGRRVLKVDHSPLTTHLTRYIYDTYDAIAEYDGSDTLEARYILGRGIDDPLVMDRRDVADVDGDNNKTEFQRFYYHTNHLGTIVAVTWWDEGSAQEKLVEEYSYDAYGSVSVIFHAPSSLVPSPSSLVSNPYLFTSRALDAETGLYYFRARYYSPILGRFISRDPLGYIDGLNLYAAYFVPNALDPLGLQGLWRRVHGHGSVVAGGVYGFGAGLLDGTINTGKGIANTAWNLGGGLIDAGGIGLDAAATALGGGFNYQPISPIGRWAAAGGSYSWGDVGNVAANAASCGGWGLGSGIGNYLAGNIDAATFSQQMGGVAAGNLLAVGLIAASTGSRPCPDKSPGPAHDASNGVRLNKSLASEEQMGEAGTPFAGEGTGVPFRDASLVADEYGGSPSDWVKKGSSSHLAPDGTRFETHWVENVRTGERVQFKTKIPGLVRTNNSGVLR